MSNIFHREKRDRYSIQKYDSFRNQDLIENLNKKLREINQNISQTSQDLFEVEAAKIRATFSGNSTWINKLQKKIFWSTIQQSSSFNQQRLIQLYKERSRVQNQLDRVNGQFWKKRILRWLSYAFLFCFILFAIWIILMGLIATLYLLPLWGSLVVIYFFIQKNKMIRR